MNNPISLWFKAISSVLQINHPHPPSTPLIATIAGLPSEQAAGAPKPRGATRGAADRRLAKGGCGRSIGSLGGANWGNPDPVGRLLGLA